mmetsp:Transcript_4894/g.7877  ORF Transcript_4894/g.7877 Transcript_4894/m.7877 type:complete len:112 (-) Transcript_4894:385-720(-)
MQKLGVVTMLCLVTMIFQGQRRKSWYHQFCTNPNGPLPVPRISTCKDGLPSPQRDSSEHSEMSSEKLHSDSRPSLAAEHTGKCLGQAARELWSLVDNDDLTLGGLLKSHAD